MGRIKCTLCFLKNQAKKSIFDPEIALRVERSDPARNSYFPTDFLSPRLQYSQLLWNCAKIKAVYRRARGEPRLEIAQTIRLNCSTTHSPGKIEYNCRYFILSFRKQIGEYKFGKNSFHTLQSTMSHCPLTNASSLKITSAYCGPIGPPPWVVRDFPPPPPPPPLRGHCVHCLEPYNCFLRIETILFCCVLWRLKIYNL